AIAKSVQPGSTLFGLCAFGAVISGVVTMMVGRGLFESFVWAGRSGFRGRLRAVLLSGVVFWLLLLGLLIGIVVWIAA
ncbi:MAG TPA: hypothetical protein VGX76_08870, partial [Pirellulales bacterium]|nr:hypothetical protein [Pirellulales bacterium]